MKKLLILLIALATVFCLTLAIGAACYEDYEIAKMEQIAEKTISYNPGGYNKDNGEIDGSLDSGVAPDWRGADGINITYKYNKLHLIRSITVTFDYAVGRGFDLEISNDGGVTWTVVANVLPVEGDETGKQTITYSVNNGHGTSANAFKFTYRGEVVQYNISLYEISITASTVLECSWNEGEVKVAGNCGVSGEILYTCTKCNANKTEIVPATGNHSWDDGVEILAPTETANGIMEYTCSVCKQTKHEDISATGHNWDEGTVVPPTCTEDGYTLYKCTDDDCSASYQAYIVTKLGHSYDDGVETKHPTLTAEGETTFSCINDGCDEFYTTPIPMATYEDSKIVIGLDNILSIEEVLNNADKASDKRDPNGVFDGKITNGGQSDNAAQGSWFAPSGSTITFTFDEEYYVLSAKLFVWSNWNQIKIEFFDAQGNAVLTHEDGKCQVMDGAETPIANINGKLVKSIKITAVGAKGDSGNCLAIHELQIVAHKHLADEGTSRYDEVVGCVENGSYKKFCYVCEKEVLVETKPSGIHDLVSEIVFPKGFDMNGSYASTCSRCDFEEKTRLKPIFYSYGFSVREDGGAGISHKIEIDLEALAVYESYAGTALEFGTVAAAAPNFEGAPIEIVDGAVAVTSEKVSLKKLSGFGYAFIEDKISNIPEFAYDTKIVLCPYIYDGKNISYINVNTDSGAEFEMISYNELLAE